MSADLRAFAEALTGLLDDHARLLAAPVTAATSIGLLETENTQLRTMVKILRVKSQALSDAVAPGRAPKEEAKWAQERADLIEAIKMSKGVVQ